MTQACPLLSRPGLYCSVPMNSGVQNSMEVLVIMDRWAIRRWNNKEEVTNYVKSVFYDMNSIFKGLQGFGINLDARITDIEIITHEAIVREEPAGSGLANGKTVTQQFKAWLATKYYAKTDHIMLLTGLDLADGGSTGTAGKAYVGAMCSKNSLSIVEAQPDGSAVITMAHELGHSLNADHDRGGCDAGHVMAAVSASNAKSANVFKFSPCSAQSIKNYLQSLYDTGSSCLSAANTRTAPISSKPLGERYTPDQICQLNYGPKSYFARYAYDRDYTSMCSTLYCTTPEKGVGHYTSVRSSDGFVCGRGKRCSLGRCVPSVGAPTTVSDTCPQGDTDYPMNDKGQTCKQALAEYTGQCSYGFQRKACCAGCEAAKTNIAGCEYGDKASWCKDYIGKNIDNCRLNSGACCLSCKDYNANPGGNSGSNCRDTFSNCASMVANNPAVCYQHEQGCCASCSKVANGNSACKYGDKVNGCTSHHCDSYPDQCCGTRGA